MYRDPAPKSPKREGEGPSLDELSAKGAHERDRLAWERRQEEQRAQEEQTDALAEEVQRKENAYLAGKAPLARLVYIAGIVVLVFAATAALGAVWPALFEARNP